MLHSDSVILDVKFIRMLYFETEISKISQFSRGIAPHPRAGRGLRHSSQTPPAYMDAENTN